MIVKQAKYFGPKRETDTINGIILHCLACGPHDVGVRYIENPGDDRHVSYHLMVAPDGELIQLVPDDHIAWHCKGWNTHTLGICLGITNQPLPQVALWAAKMLLTDKIAKYKITWAKPHSAVDPSRRDPGSAIDPLDMQKFFAKFGVLYNFQPAKK